MIEEASKRIEEQLDLGLKLTPQERPMRSLMYRAKSSGVPHHRLRAEIKKGYLDRKVVDGRHFIYDDQWEAYAASGRLEELRGEVRKGKPSPAPQPANGKEVERKEKPLKPPPPSPGIPSFIQMGEDMFNIGNIRSLNWVPTRKSYRLGLFEDSWQTGRRADRWLTRKDGTRVKARIMTDCPVELLDGDGLTYLDPNDQED